MQLIFGFIVGIVFVAGCAATPNSSRVASDNRVLERRTRPDEETARADNIRGLDLMKNGKLDEAEKAFRQAMSVDNDFGLAHNNLGRLFYLQGKLYLAGYQFQYAIKLIPDQPEPRNNLGLVFEKGGKLDDAIEEYTRAITIDPNNVEAIGNLTRARVRRGDNDAQVRKLMDEIVQRDTRPEWVDWAKQWLAVTAKPLTLN